VGKRNHLVFTASIARGRIAEHIVARWLRDRGWSIVPSYDYTGSDGGKAPRMTGRDRSHVIPDLDVARSGTRMWCEVKAYQRAVINRQHQLLVHGIKGAHYHDYLSVERETGTRVYIMIIELDSGVLLGAPLATLTTWPCLCEGCRSGRFCRAPISRGVYWSREQMVEVHRFPAGELSDLDMHDPVE